MNSSISPTPALTQRDNPSQSRVPWQKLVPFLFLFPALLTLLLFRIVPAVYTVVSSLRHNSEWVGFENYRFLFESETVIDSLQTTLLFNVIINPLQIALALGLAILLAERVYAAGIWRMMVFLPAVVPLSVSAIVWGIAFRPDGILNAILEAIGIPAQPWLTSPDQALLSIMILASWAGVGFWMIFLIAGLKEIPISLREAAALDGAGYWQTMMFVILPMMRRSIAFVLVADTVANFLLFPPVQILTRGGPAGSTNLFIFEVYQNAFTFADYGLAYAEMVILIAVMLAIVILQFSLLRTQEGI